MKITAPQLGRARVLLWEELSLQGQACVQRDQERARASKALHKTTAAADEKNWLSRFRTNVACSRHTHTQTHTSCLQYHLGRVKFSW